MAKKQKKSDGRKKADREFTGPDHDPRTGVPDTGDVIGPDADDPDPPVVVDRSDPSFVDPAEVQ